MMLTRGEFFAKLGEMLDDSDVRFSFADEELEVERVDIEADMDEVWFILVPKAETEEETGPWSINRRPENEPYIGRHRKQD